MTKRLNKFYIFKKYFEDPWGFLHLKKKRTKLIKLLIWNKFGKYHRTNSKYLVITQSSWKRKRFFFKTLRSKAIHLTLKFRRYFSNLTVLQLKRICKKSSFLERSYKKSIASIIETRVDTILIRSNLFTSVRTIRQWINHGFILINLKPVYSSNFNLKIGDVLSFKKKVQYYLYDFFKYRYFNFISLNHLRKNKKKFFNNKYRKWNYMKSRKKYRKMISKEIPLFFPPYLDMNYKLLFFFLWRYPKWIEIPFLSSFNSNFIFGYEKNKI